MIARASQRARGIREALRGGGRYVRFTDLFARAPERARDDERFFDVAAGVRREGRKKDCRADRSAAVPGQ